MSPVDDLRKQILSKKLKVEGYTKTGRDEDAENAWIEVQKLERRLEKEEAKLPAHPALVFGPIAQTVAIMAAISLGMSVSPLPYEMYPFYRLFSTITTLAVLCLVVRSSIVWIEYHSIISSLPSLATKDEYKEASFTDWLTEITSKNRPDEWQHSRSHPSHFLTTRHAAPRLFPFPLGKTRPDVSVAEELWWEGGNAPHVGHFNKPAAGVARYPSDVLAQKMLERGKKKVEIEDQQELWKKRIRSIQILSLIAITSFISRKLAVVALVYLVYTTLSTEIENMLQPPRSLDDLTNTSLQLQAIRNQEPPKSKTMAQGVQGMGYIYQTNDTGTGTGLDKQNVALPIVTVAPHVLMTSESSYYTGFGEKIKGDNRRLG